MILNADEERVGRKLRHLHNLLARGQAGKNHAVLFEQRPVQRIELVPMPKPLLGVLSLVKLSRQRVGPEPDGPTA